MAQTAPDAEPKPGILWLASYPKSGNTWTRTFLHNLFKVMHGLSDAEQDINRINELSAWDISARKYERHLGAPPKDVDRERIAAIRPDVQAELADQSDGLALVKTHHALVMDRGHPTINFSVTSGAIYIIRNPLDVAISFAHHMSATIDQAITRMQMRNLETAVTETSVYEVYGSWSQHVESWTRKPHRAIHIMRYEDMHEAPMEAFGTLARFLTLDPTPEQLAEAIDRSSFERLRKQEEEAGFREKPKNAERFFREGRAGQWREVLTSEQVDRIVADHGSQMERFGYLPE